MHGADVSYDAPGITTDLLYMPIPKDRPYDGTRGMAVTIEEMLATTPPAERPTSEPSKLGPLDALHIVMESRPKDATAKPFHFEGWAAWDEPARTLYALEMSTVEPAGEYIKTVHSSFAPRVP